MKRNIVHKSDGSVALLKCWELSPVVQRIGSSLKRPKLRDDAAIYPNSLYIIKNVSLTGHALLLSPQNHLIKTV